MSENAVQKLVKDLESRRAYWQERCELAESYIRKTPCDPDVTKDQLKAYREWQDFIMGVNR